MKIYLASILFFGLVFIIFPSSKYDFQVNLIDTWIWDKQGGYGTQHSNISENPTSNLAGYKNQGSFYSFPSGKFIKMEEGFLLDYSIFGEGFYQYKKLGDEVSFFDANNELFWKKPYSSYPRPGYNPNLIPFVSGDGNIVFLVDKNGNQTGVKQVTGRFATDISYSYYSDHTIILFSGGEYFLLDGAGVLLQKHNSKDIEHNQSYFAKSVVLSPNGKAFAIHAQNGEVDTISVYNSENELIYSKNLNSIIPNKIYLALDDDGSLLYYENDKFSLLDKDGDEVSNYKADTKKVYQTVFVKDGIFFFLSGNELQIINKKGIVLRSLFLPSNLKPVRVLPSKAANNYYIETSKDLRQITLRK